jgi:hypothetical protein
MFTNLTATQINRLAQRLSEAPLGRSASVAAAAERFERLLAARIGADRAPIAIEASLTAPGVETAEGRLVAEVEGGPELAPEPTTDKPVAPVETVVEPAPVAAPVETDHMGEAEFTAFAKTAEAKRRRRAAVAALEEAKAGILPPQPDFSASPHARFRNKLEGLIALAEKGNAEALKAITINPVSSSPRALARFRDLCVIALEARCRTEA